MARKKKNGQMAELIGLMNQLLVNNAGPSKKRKRKRKRRNGTARQSSMSVTNEGSITLSRRELLTTISLPANTAEKSGSVSIEPDSFPFLKTVFKSFDRVQWKSLHFYYKPAVGTVYGGLVTLGMDWDYKSSDVARSLISGFTPSLTMAAWADSEAKPMVLQNSKLQSRTWYIPRAKQDEDKGPGKLHYAVAGTMENKEKTIGEIWAVYSIVMQGTNPA